MKPLFKSAGFLTRSHSPNMRKSFYWSRVLLVLIFLASMVQPAIATPPGGHLSITEVSVDLSDSTITILGDDLDFGPASLTVTLGELGSLALISATAFEIVAELPNPIAPGDYLITVSRGNGQSQSDEYALTIGNGGQNGGGPVMILTDNSSPPKKMGTVLTITPFAFGVPFLAENTQRGVLTLMRFIDSANEERKVGLFVTPTDFAPKDSLLFLTDDCTGQPYLGAPVLDVEFPGTLEPVAVHPVDALGNIDVTKRALYISEFGATRVERTFKSSLVSTFPSFLGVCNTPLSLKVFSVEAEKLVPDLLNTFRPPYTLNITP
jgi:hypothetical protein